MKMKLGLYAAALMSLTVYANANADMIVDWNLDGMAGTEATRAANSAASGITGNNLLRGAGLTGSAAANSMSATGWTSQSTDYFSFGFTVANGYTVDLTNLVLATRSSATGPGTMALYYSGDNFSSALYTFTQPSAAFLNSIVNLSALPNLTGAVEFRIAEVGTNAAGGGTTGSSGTFRVSEYYDGTSYTNLEFTGSVTPVPLPAAAWLLGSGLFGLAGLSRKRKDG